MTLCICIAFVPHSLAARAETAKPTRVINLVYDDSSSMISDGVSYLDRWCQAKYALEVFAAMLEENDTMNVYAMSDFSYTDIDYFAVPPHITLMGKNGVSENVSLIHNMVTEAHSTPFQTVEKAYSDLSQASADEKWLVVLTDGTFTKDFKNTMTVEEIDGYFSKKDSDISVMYLAIGSSALNITRNENNNIYTDSAANSTDILSKITEISNRIFDRNRLQVDPANGNFSFDIPMNELIVFAQGKNVQISGIKPVDGTEITADSEPVEVKYSETAAKNYATNKSVVVNKNLEGKIAYFTGDFDAGDYTVNASGADTIEVYYRPNVDIAIYLVNSEGTRLSTSDPIPQGTYTLEYGFVKAGTDVMLPQSELLGEIDFSAAASFNGTPDGKQYSNGDSITIPEGSMDIDATAQYLEYNTVSTSLHYDVFQDKPLNFTIEDSHAYTVETYGFDNADKPITLTVSLADRELTADEWNELDIPKVEFISNSKNLGEMSIEKTDKPGVFEIYPSVYESNPRENAVGDFTFHVSLNQKIGMSVWSGQTDGVLHISDGMSAPERYPWLIPLLISIAALILLLIWWITRKVLPKKIRIQQGSTKFYVSPNPSQLEGLEASCAYSKKKGRIMIKSPSCELNCEAECSVTLLLKAVDRRYVKSKKRKVCVVDIRTTGSVYNVTLNNVDYVQDEHGDWVKAAALGVSSPKKLEHEIKNATVGMKTGSSVDPISRCECKLKHI